MINLFFGCDFFDRLVLILLKLDEQLEVKIILICKIFLDRKVPGCLFFQDLYLKIFEIRQYNNIPKQQDANCTKLQTFKKQPFF